MIQLDEKGNLKQDHRAESALRVEEFKKRMLAWSNPVEFVNNMYGSHPDDDGTEYFKRVFGK